MEIKWNTDFIDLQNLIDHSRGDKDRMLKYLIQFQELIPQRVEKLKEKLLQNDRKMIRQILHQMSPQLKFFGVPGVAIPIQRLALEYESMPLEELNASVSDILIKLEGAILEVNKILQLIQGNN